MQSKLIVYIHKSNANTVCIRRGCKRVVVGWLVLFCFEIRVHCQIKIHTRGTMYLIVRW
jgi:hypothetical protein